MCKKVVCGFGKKVAGDYLVGSVSKGASLVAPMW